MDRTHEARDTRRAALTAALIGVLVLVGVFAAGPPGGL